MADKAPSVKLTCPSALQSYVGDVVCELPLGHDGWHRRESWPDDSPQRGEPYPDIWQWEP